MEIYLYDRSKLSSSKLPFANKGTTLEFRSCAIVSLKERSCASKRMPCTHTSLSIHGALAARSCVELMEKSESTKDKKSERRIRDDFTAVSVFHHPFIRFLFFPLNSRQLKPMIVLSGIRKQTGSLSSLFHSRLEL